MWWSGVGWGEFAGKIPREILQTDPWTHNEKSQGINEGSEYPKQFQSESTKGVTTNNTEKPTVSPSF